MWDIAYFTFYQLISVYQSLNEWMNEYINQWIDTVKSKINIEDFLIFEITFGFFLYEYSLNVFVQ